MHESGYARSLSIDSQWAEIEQNAPDVGQG